jgi:hypothetical protein
MMLYRSIIFLFLLQHGYTSAQIKGYASTNLPSVLNIYHSYVTAEYNTYLTSHIRLNGSIGLITGADLWNGGRKNSGIFEKVGKSDGRGFRLAVEPQFYFAPIGKPNIAAAFYIGLEISFAKYSYMSNRLVSDTLRETESFNVNSTIWGANILFGKTFYNGKLMVISGSFGLGLRQILVKNDLGFPVSRLNKQYHLSEYIIPEENGKHFRFAPSINMKVGFRLF